MATTIRKRWTSMLDAGIPRRDRVPCSYDAYIPDALAGREFQLDGAVAADVADAEIAIARLNAEATTLANTEALARLLLRAESVASSRIEGLEIGGRRLLRAEAAHSLGEDPRDVTADEVLGNIDAMAWSMDALTRSKKITVKQLLEVHRRLLAGTRLAHQAGRIRTEQNWIGGSSYNPCSASFVPPPPEMVEPLLEDLCAFCNESALPPIVQAAIAHAQFETIHPFADGNGRTGRALIHMVLRRRGLTTRISPPVSLILATWSRDYVSGLTATRYSGAAHSANAREGVNRWIALFATACRRAVDDAARFEARIGRLEASWRERLAPLRAGSSAERLLAALSGAPIITVNGARDITGRSFQAANEAITRLVEAGILKQISVGRRNRAFEAAEVVRAFTDLERQLASPAGNTRHSPPKRAVPRRGR